uniref:Uncharacterized protein n=1 Tax=Oryza brachyantha TaxID=4533 RepID=J3N847_ORYBR
MGKPGWRSARSASSTAASSGVGAAAVRAPRRAHPRCMLLLPAVACRLPAVAGGAGSGGSGDARVHAALLMQPLPRENELFINYRLNPEMITRSNCFYPKVDNAWTHYNVPDVSVPSASTISPKASTEQTLNGWPPKSVASPPVAHEHQAAGPHRARLPVEIKFLKRLASGGLPMALGSCGPHRPRRLAISPSACHRASRPIRRVRTWRLSRRRAHGGEGEPGAHLIFSHAIELGPLPYLSHHRWLYCGKLGRPHTTS